MKVSGISRTMMREEIDKMEAERKKSIMLDQAVCMPFMSDYGVLTEMPNREEKDVFMKEFKKIQGFKEELYEPMLAINISANMNSLADVLINPTILASEGKDEELLNAGMSAAEYYIDKMKTCSQDDLDKNPYMQAVYKNLSKTKMKEAPFIKQYSKGTIFLGGDCVEEDYKYGHNIFVATTDVSLPVITDASGVIDERLSFTDIELTKEAIEMAEGCIMSMDCTTFQYFAYMAHLKPEVKKIYIVLKSKKEIEVFHNTILPMFEYPEKIECITFFDSNVGNIIMECEINYYFIRMWDEIHTRLERYLPLYDTIYNIDFEKLHKKCFTYMEQTLVEHIKNVIFSEILFEAGRGVDFGIQAGHYAVNKILKKYEDVKILTPSALRNAFNSDTVKSQLKGNLLK